MVFNRGPLDNSEPKRLAIKIDARLKLGNSDGNVMQAFYHDAFSIGANERNPSVFRFEPKPTTSQFRASLRAEFESIAHRALVSTPVQDYQLAFPVGAITRAEGNASSQTLSFNPSKKEGNRSPLIGQR